MTIITAEIAREFLDYDPENGILRWKRRDKCWFKREQDYKTWNARFAGQASGCFGGEGYLYTAIFHHLFRTHRVIWLIVYGVWPSEQVDHINGDRIDNRQVNLRLANNAQNAVNRPANKRKLPRGVSLHHNGSYRAQIGSGPSHEHLGLFDNPEDASVAYEVAAKHRYREFATSEYRRS
jgi:hypothetical protein